MLIHRTQICSVLVAGALLGCSHSESEYRALTPEQADPQIAARIAPEEKGDAKKGEADPAEAAAAEAVTSTGVMQTTSAMKSSDVQPISVAAAQTAEPAPTSAPAPASPDVPLAMATGADPKSLPAKSETTAKPAASPIAPLQIKLLVPQKDFQAEGKDKALRVNFDDLDLLKVCNMEPVPPNVMDYLPDWLKDLNGKKIILRGWMFPAGRQDGITSFMFVRDNGICCFGRDPKVYDKLGVTMQKGLTTSYIAGRPFDVEATLQIEPDIEGSEEGLWWLYHLEGAKVIDQ